MNSIMTDFYPLFRLYLRLRGQVLDVLSDAELAFQPGGDFRISPRINLAIYQEALLIFYGKISVYLKILGKTPSAQWEHWIA